MYVCYRKNTFNLINSIGPTSDSFCISASRAMGWHDRCPARFRRHAVHFHAAPASAPQWRWEYFKTSVLSHYQTLGKAEITRLTRRHPTILHTGSMRPPEAGELFAAARYIRRLCRCGGRFCGHRDISLAGRIPRGLPDAGLGGGKTPPRRNSNPMIWRSLAILVKTPMPKRHQSAAEHSASAPQLVAGGPRNCRVRVTLLPTIPKPQHGCRKGKARAAYDRESRARL